MEKYLRLYAEPEAVLIDGLAGPPWAGVLVVPARNESAELLRSPPRCAGRWLLILVVNQPAAAPARVAAANRALAAAIRATGEPAWQSACGTALQLYRDSGIDRDVLLVDRFSPGREMPPKGGVGHARKIGCDIALALFHRGQIESPWIHCSDGDVRLPADYFQHVTEQGIDEARTAALIYPFEHVANPGAEGVMLATRLYELSLRYYVAGLKFAGSPYAFHTIGSTLALNAHHYARVRGFPKRDAGEDFYLLNKLAKVGEVQDLAIAARCRPIRIRARRSDRVPFGTGAAVNTILRLDDPVGGYRYYHPAVFSGLQLWLRSWPAIWDAQSTDFDALIPPPASAGPETASDGLVRALREIGAEKALEHAFRQSRDPVQFSRQMHTWFDAFRTLKLIHRLRDNHHPSIGYRALTTHSAFRRLLKADPELGLFFRSIRDRIRI
jgi:hypothetical protein